MGRLIFVWNNGDAERFAVEDEMWDECLSDIVKSVTKYVAKKPNRYPTLNDINRRTMDLI